MKLNELTVLWDMDGTILDTFDLHYKTWRDVFDPGKHPFNKEMFTYRFGENNRQTVPDYLGYAPTEQEYQSIVTAKENQFRTRLFSETNLFPGITDWFAYLSANGAKQAIASSAIMENIIAIVDGFSIKHYFTALVSGENLPSKPAPDVFLAAAHQLGTDPSRCLVVEDSIHGINAGKNAGMLTAFKKSCTHFQPGVANFEIADYSGKPEVFFSEIVRFANNSG